MKKIFIITTLIIAVVGGSYWYYLSSGRDKQLIKQGNNLIAKIEVYKKQHHELPNSLTDMGIIETEEGSLYYEKITSTTYRVWFGTELGELKVYESEEREWN